jgi:predicted transposase/invertase (TIGR01784 family)
MSGVMRKFLRPTNDVVFKMLFADPKNRELLIWLLEATLRPKLPIATARVMNPAIRKKEVKEYGAVLDIRVRLADGLLLDVEMQCESDPDLPARALHYWAKMYCAQTVRGGRFSDLRPCVSILILGYRPLPEGRFHSIFRLQELHDRRTFSELLEVHTVELPRLPPVGQEGAEARLAGWGRFLAARSDKELKELAMRSPELAKARQALVRLSRSPKAQRLAEDRRLARMRTDSWVTAAEAKGRAEGEALGEAKALLVVLAAHGFEPSEARRRQVLACTDAAILERWLARAVKARSLDEVFEQVTRSTRRAPTP